MPPAAGDRIPDDDHNLRLNYFIIRLPRKVTQRLLFLAVHREEFEKRRKAHYREFEKVQMARKLIEEEDEDEDDGAEDELDKLDASKIIVVETVDVVLPPELPATASMDASPLDEEAVEEEKAGVASLV